MSGTDTNFNPLALVPMGRLQGEYVWWVSETTPSFELIMWSCSKYCLLPCKFLPFWVLIYALISKWVRKNRSRNYKKIMMTRDGTNSLFFLERKSIFLVCFHLNLVRFLVTFLLKKSPFSIIFGLYIIHFFFKWGAFFVKLTKFSAYIEQLKA